MTIPLTTSEVLLVTVETCFSMSTVCRFNCKGLNFKSVWLLFHFHYLQLLLLESDRIIPANRFELLKGYISEQV